MSLRNRKDTETQLLLELKHWFNRQVRDMFADFYLYYMPTTTEHDGGIIICKDTPRNPDYKLARPERIDKSATVIQNFNHIRLHTLPYLPILAG